MTPLLKGPSEREGGPFIMHSRISAEGIELLSASFSIDSLVGAKMDCQPPPLCPAPVRFKRPVRARVSGVQLKPNKPNPVSFLNLTSSCIIYVSPVSFIASFTCPLYPLSVDSPPGTESAPTSRELFSTGKV